MEPVAQLATEGPLNLRVLVWSPRGAGARYSGAGRAAGALYAMDRGRRFSPDLAHAEPGESGGGPFAASHLIRPLAGNGKLSLLRFLHASRAWLRTHAGAYQVLHGISAFAMTVQPAAWAEATGLPAVVKITSHDLDLKLKGGLAGWLGLGLRRRRLVAGLSGAIALNRAIERELLACGVPAERIARIPNPVDLQRFRPADAARRAAQRAALGLGDGPVLACCGVIGERKRQHLLIEALDRPELAGWRLLLIGPFRDEATEARVHALAATGTRRGRVTCTGLVADPERLFAAADVFCLPSRQEGMPNAVVEALACGLPCVLTPFAGADELVEDGAGRLADPDPAALAAAVARVQHEAATMGARARATAEAKHDPEHILDLHQALFRRILSAWP